MDDLLNTRARKRERERETDSGRGRGVEVDPLEENGGKNLVEKAKRGKELVGTKVEGGRTAT